MKSASVVSDTVSLWRICCALVFGLEILIPASARPPASKFVTRSLAVKVHVLASAASSANSRSESVSAGVIGNPVSNPPCSRRSLSSATKKAIGDGMSPCIAPLRIATGRE